MRIADQPTGVRHVLVNGVPIRVEGSSTSPPGPDSSSGRARTLVPSVPAGRRDPSPRNGCALASRAHYSLE
jgi:hypothetical protein